MNKDNSGVILVPMRIDFIDDLIKCLTDALAWINGFNACAITPIRADLIQSFIALKELLIQVKEDNY